MKIGLNRLLRRTQTNGKGVSLSRLYFKFRNQSLLRVYKHTDVMGDTRLHVPIHCPLGSANHNCDYYD
jgi:hypothetical protein